MARTRKKPGQEQPNVMARTRPKPRQEQPIVMARMNGQEGGTAGEGKLRIKCSLCVKDVYFEGELALRDHLAARHLCYLRHKCDTCGRSVWRLLPCGYISRKRPDTGSYSTGCVDS